MVKKRSRQRRNRARYGQGRAMMAQLPGPFRRVGQDQTSLHCRGLLDMTSGTSNTAGYLSLMPGARSYATLYTFVSTLDALATAYEMFVVTRMTVRVIPTIPLTSGAMIAVGYETQYDAETQTPDSYSDVMISANHVSTNQVEEKSFTFQPINYSNDWFRTSIGANSSVRENGYLQWFSNYTGGGPGTVIGYLDVSFDITFAGLYRARA